MHYFSTSRFGVSLAVLFILSLFCPTQVTAIKRWQEHSNLVFARDAAFHGHDIWIATEKGLAKYDTLNDTIETWNSENGLSGDYFTCVMVDSAGIIWAGTYGSGVFRFDGTTWSNITIDDHQPDNTAYDIAIGPDGVIWMVNSLCLIRYNGLNLERLYLNDDPGIKGLSSIAVDNNGVVWITTKGWGLFKYDGSDWKRYSESGNGYSVAVGPHGVVWVGADDGIYRYIDDELAIIQPLYPDFSEGSYEITSITVGPDSMAWATTPVGICHGYDRWGWWDRYDVNGLNLPSYRMVYGYLKNEVPGAVVVISENREIWSIYSNGFICHFEDNKWFHKATLNTLGSISIGPIIEDSKGSLWVGSHDLGLYRYGNNRWDYFGPKDGILHYWITALDEDSSGRMWVGTKAGLNLIKNDQCSTIFEGVSVGDITCGKNDDIWVNTSGGIIHVNARGEWHQLDTGEMFEHSTVIDIDTGPDNSLWVCTQNQLFRCQDNTWKQYYISQSIPFQCILVDDSGTVWFGAGYGNVLAGCLNPYNGKWKLFTGEDGLVNNVRYFVKDYNRGIWAYNGYLQQFEYGTWLYDDALNIGNGSESIACQKNGRIWSSFWNESGGNMGPYDYDPLGLYSFDDYIITSVDNSVEVPTDFSITGIFPNPFNSQTTLTFTLKHEDFVTLALYSISGQKIRDLFSRNCFPGTYTVTWNGHDNNSSRVSSGLYIMRLGIHGRYVSEKVTLIK